MQGADCYHSLGLTVLNDGIVTFLSRITGFLPGAESNSEDGINLGITEITKLMIEHYPVEERPGAPAKMFPKFQKRSIDNRKISGKVHEADPL